MAGIYTAVEAVEFTTHWLCKQWLSDHFKNVIQSQGSSFTGSACTQWFQQVDAQQKNSPDQHGLMKQWFLQFPPSFFQKGEIEYQLRNFLGFLNGCPCNVKQNR